MISDNMTARAARGTGDAQVTKRIAEVSPRFKARIAVVLYLMEGTAAVFGQYFIQGKFVVSGNAAATASAILANKPLFLMGFTSALLAVAFHLAYTVLFYDLFKPVNRSVSLIAAFFSVVACALQAGSSLFQIAPVIVLGSGHSLSAFTTGQVQAQALLLLNLNAQAFNIYLVFFGFWLMLIGYLIFRSAFLPRTIGVLLALAGVGVSLPLLYPPLATYLSPYNLVIDGIGEVSLLLWLLIIGVNVERWKQQERHTSNPDSRVPEGTAV